MIKKSLIFIFALVLSYLIISLVICFDTRDEKQVVNQEDVRHSKLQKEISKIEFQYMKFDTTLMIDSNFYVITMYINDDNENCVEYYWDGVICPIGDTSIYPTPNGRKNR